MRMNKVNVFNKRKKRNLNVNDKKNSGNDEFSLNKNNTINGICRLTRRQPNYIDICICEGARKRAEVSFLPNYIETVKLGLN